MTQTQATLNINFTCVVRLSMAEKIAYLNRETPSAEKKVLFMTISPPNSLQWHGIHEWYQKQCEMLFQSLSKQRRKFHTTYVHSIETNKPDPADPDSTLLVSLKQSLEGRTSYWFWTLKIWRKRQVKRSLSNSHPARYHRVESSWWWIQLIVLITVDHFYSFSIDHVISELHTHAPDVFHLTWLVKLIVMKMPSTLKLHNSGLFHHCWTFWSVAQSRFLGYSFWHSCSWADLGGFRGLQPPQLSESQYKMQHYWSA